MTALPALPFEGDTIPQSTSDRDESQSLTVLTFTLGEQVMAVDVSHVREILDQVQVKPLPGAPSDVLGMIDLRGQGICIVDLTARLGTYCEAVEKPRIIVFELAIDDGETHSVGILADRVLRVCETAPDQIEPVPETFSTWRCDAADGMLRTEDGIALILEIGQLLSPATAF